MSPFIGEAFIIGAKQGVSLALSTSLVLALFRREHLDQLRRSFLAGVAVVLLATLAVMNLNGTHEFRATIVKLTGYVFGLLYLFSLGSLYHATGTDLLGRLKGPVRGSGVLVPLVFLLTVLYFAPDMAGSSLFLVELFSLAGRNQAVFAAAAAGFVLAASLSHLAFKRIGMHALRLFGLPQALLVLALMKLMFGGVRGFTELSLIPSVQAGLMKLVHDMVHQLFVMIMVPDHPLLTMTAWKYIGLVFGNTVGLWLSLILFIMPLAIFIKKHFAEAIIPPPEAARPALQRLFIKAARDQRLLKSIPVFAFMLFILSTWFVQSGESAGTLYMPEPKVITAAAGKAVIPLQTPAEDLRDGMLHKYTITINDEPVHLLIMRRPDGTLAVCLDACEICPPDGYGQARAHVVCVSCNTPMPFESLGKPGGCNPIPLEALVTDKVIQVQIGEIAVQMKKINSGKGSEGGAQ